MKKIYLPSIYDTEYFEEKNNTEMELQIKANEEGNKIKHLWEAVLLQAITDATTNYKRVENKIEKTKAISWLTNNGPDFKLVCHLAGQSETYVKKKAKEAIQKSLKKKTKKINTKVSQKKKPYPGEKINRI